MGDPAEDERVDRRHAVGEYLRLERWDVPAPPGSDLFEIGGRAPLDAHQMGAGGGLRTGALLTSVDSLGGFLCGLSVHPEWIVTTSMMATIAHLSIGVRSGCTVGSCAAGATRWWPRWTSSMKASPTGRLPQSP